MTDFEKLYNTYFNDVYLYIRRLSGDEQIAEEITSETFFKAMHSIYDINELGAKAGKLTISSLYYKVLHADYNGSILSFFWILECISFNNHLQVSVLNFV